MSIKVYQALSGAQQTIGALVKGSMGPRGSYVDVDSAIKAGKQALAEHGLTLVTVSAELISLGEGLEGAGLALKRRFVLYHNSGESLELSQTFPVVVSRRMPLDHATAAADSFGMTYLLRGLLLFPRGEEHIDTSDASLPRESGEKAPKQREKSVERVAARRAEVRAADKRSASPIHSAATKLGAELDESKTPDDLPDPSADDLEAAGWSGPVSPQELEALGDDVVPRPLAVDIFKHVGVRTWSRVFSKGEQPTGKTLRLVCLFHAQAASA
jgi:hypothetical protein